MRFKSEVQWNCRAFAVAGTNTISFAIQPEDDADLDGLLGFAVERHDLTENERYYMPGFKVFRSVYPNPQPGLQVSTRDQPVQSFLWDDFTAKPEHKYEYLFHPIRGKPRPSWTRVLVRLPSA